MCFVQTIESHFNQIFFLSRVHIYRSQNLNNIF